MGARGVPFMKRTTLFSLIHLSMMSWAFSLVISDAFPDFPSCYSVKRKKREDPKRALLRLTTLFLKILDSILALFIYFINHPNTHIVISSSA